MAHVSAWDRASGKLIIHFFSIDGAPRKLGTYIDRPGEYFRSDGSLAPESEARAAGIDVDAERERAEALKEFNEAKDKLEAQMDELRAKARMKKLPVTEAKAVKSIDMELRESPNFRRSYDQSNKTWSVIQKDDDSVLAEGVTKEEAAQLLHDDVYGVTG